MEFIDIVPQQGKEGSDYDYKDLKFHQLAYSDYGLTSLTAEAISDFRKTIEDDKDTALEYLVRKMGFDPKDDDETQRAYDIYEDKDMITSKKQKTDEYICVMHKSLSSDEVQQCFDDISKKQKAEDATESAKETQINFTEEFKDVF